MNMRRIAAVFSVSLCMLAMLAAGCSTHTAAVIDRSYPASIMTMKEWKGTPAPDSAARRHAITTITLHHQGETFTPGKDVPSYLRNLQAWSRREKHWIDIPYHYIVDLEGNVYEGRDIRFAGDTNTQYDPAGHALVCVLGNYEDISPTVAQLETVVKLFAWLCTTHGVPPERITSHKDVASGTVCPGKYLHPYVQSGFFREEVMRELQ